MTYPWFLDDMLELFEIEFIIGMSLIENMSIMQHHGQLFIIIDFIDLVTDVSEIIFINLPFALLIKEIKDPSDSTVSLSVANDFTNTVHKVIFSDWLF